MSIAHGHYYFRQGGYDFTGVCLFVRLSAGLRENYSTDFHQMRRKGGTWATKKPLDFGGNPDHVALRLGLG